MALGSLLDDNNFHDVVISREKRDIVMSVDRVRIRDKIFGDFLKLNLDRVFFVGGVPRIEEGLVVYDNFSGCLENVFINFSKSNSAAASATTTTADQSAFKDTFNTYGQLKKTFFQLQRLSWVKSFFLVHQKKNSFHVLKSFFHPSRHNKAFASLFTFCTVGREVGRTQQRGK